MKFTLILALFLTGCTKTVYVDRFNTVKVPVECEIPKVNCELGGIYAGVAVNAYKCIELQKQAMKVCQPKIK